MKNAELKKKLTEIHTLLSTAMMPKEFRLVPVWQLVERAEELLFKLENELFYRNWPEAYLRDEELDDKIDAYVTQPSP